ncbi:hypothetical protein DJ019_02110 [Phenylobacterium kunshanense]|uniref:Dystroglycan-type cadherin-like domain-containing protein n=1 Tax=Phenylobacterium kunshanense TaxID=1445034 RepID=A0A328BQP7_9CAUL|nr:hypothetical protein DJ019_02110 [Phenylobacterium kunshanense]
MVRRFSLGLGIIPARARPVPTAPPVNTVLPSITGVLTQGQTLTADPGSWTGLPSGAFSYQWQRSGSNISGATNSTYVAQSADVSAGANAITVEVTATNDLGSTTAESAGVTIAAPLSISGTPGGANVGAAYSFTPSSAGGHTPKTYALTGTLPEGLSFNTSTGAITGTPVSSGTASGLNITVTDADGLTASLGTFSIVVSAGSTADIDSFTIVGATALDPVNVGGTDYGIDGHGILAEVVTDELTGTPLGSSFSVRVRNPGFKNGVAADRDTVFKGVGLLPKQATSATYVNTPHTETPSAGKLKFWVVLHYDPDGTNALAADGVDVCRYVDQIFSATEIVSVTVEEGWYSTAGGGDVSSGVITNSSTLDIDTPPIEVKTLNLERDVNEGSTRTFRAKVSHLYGQSGRMFDVVKVRGRDASNNYTAYTTVSATTAYDPVGDGLTYTEIVEATYSTTGLNDGVMCRDEYLAYPLIGTAPLDSTTLESDPKDTRYPQEYRNIRSTAWQRVYAVVESGAAGPGTASTTLATAEADPFPSWHAAYNAIQAANNTANGSNTCDSGVIYARNTTGSPITLDKAGNFTGVIGSACCEIKPHPSNTADLIFGMAAAAHTFPTRVIWRDMKWVRTGTAGAFTPGQSQAGNELTVFQSEGCTINHDTTSGTLPWFDDDWARANLIGYTFSSNTTPGAATSGLGAASTKAYHARLACGVRNTTTTSLRVVAYTFLCAKGSFNFFAKGSGQPAREGMLLGSTILTATAAAQGIASDGATEFPVDGRGFHYEQSVMEYSVDDIFFNIGASSTNPADNGIITYFGHPQSATGGSTTPTATTNVAYCDVSGLKGVKRHIRMQLSGVARYAIKTCWFEYVAEGAGRVSNWKSWLKAGWAFNALMYGRDPGSEGVAGSGAQPEWAGFCAGPGEIFGDGDPTFTDNNQGLTGGGGTYTLSGSSQPLATVPTGHQKYTYDLAGNTRRTDGTGYAWPYEGP